MTLIATSAVACLITLYSGLFELIAAQYDKGGLHLGAGMLLGVTCWLLCKHSDDLIDRR